GHSAAACAFSPQRPQPTQPSSTVATGSTFSGSEAAFNDNVGQPDRRMHEWSPEHVSSSTAYLTRTTDFLNREMYLIFGQVYYANMSVNKTFVFFTLSRVATNCCRAFGRRFDAERMARDYVDVYARLINDGGPNR